MLQIRNILDPGYKVMLEIQKAKMIFPINNWAHCQFLPGRKKKNKTKTTYKQQISNPPSTHPLWLKRGKLGYLD